MVQYKENILIKKKKGWRQLIMMFGEPHKFAIFIKVVEEWNDKQCIANFYNGILFYSVNGKLFPNEIITMPLGHEIASLKLKLNNILIDTELFNMELKSLVEKLIYIRLIESEETYNKYFFDITPNSSNECENDFKIFAVSNGYQVRLIGVNNYNYCDVINNNCNIDNIGIYEAFISKTELDDLILKLDLAKL